MPNMHFNKKTLVLGSAIALTAFGVGMGGYLLIHYMRFKKTDSDVPQTTPKAFGPPAIHDKAPTVETLMNWVQESTHDGKKRIPNDTLIPRLEREHAGAFPLIKSPQDLKNCPVGTIIYDRNYELMTAQDNHPASNDEDVLIHRGPLHILAVPRDK